MAVIIKKSVLILQHTSALVEVRFPLSTHQCNSFNKFLKFSK